MSSLYSQTVSHSHKANGGDCVRLRPKRVDLYSIYIHMVRLGFSFLALKNGPILISQLQLAAVTR